MSGCGGWSSADRLDAFPTAAFPCKPACRRPCRPIPAPPPRRGDDGEPFAAGAAALTPHFIVLGLPDGTLAFYDAASQGLAAEFAHGGGAITALFPSADGTL